MSTFGSKVRRASISVLLVLVAGQQTAHASEAARNDIRVTERDFQAFDRDMGSVGTDVPRMTDLIRPSGLALRRELVSLSSGLTADVASKHDTFASSFKTVSLRASAVADAIGRLSAALPDSATASLSPGMLAAIQQARSNYSTASIQLEVALQTYDHELEKLSLSTVSLDGYRLGDVYFLALIASVVLFVGMLVWSLSTAARGMTKFWFARLGLTVVVLWSLVGAAGTYCWFWWVQRHGGDLELVWIPLVAGALRLVVGVLQYRSQANALHDDQYVTAMASEVAKVGAAALQMTGPVPIAPLHDHPAVGLLSERPRVAAPVMVTTPLPPPPPRRPAVSS